MIVKEAAMDNFMLSTLADNSNEMASIRNSKLIAKWLKEKIDRETEEVEQSVSSLDEKA
jgi:hypothetical protein